MDPQFESKQLPSHISKYCETLVFTLTQLIIHLVVANNLLQASQPIMIIIPYGPSNNQIANLSKHIVNAII